MEWSTADMVFFEVNGKNEGRVRGKQKEISENFQMETAKKFQNRISGDI
jgi:hypothetical protein